MGNKKGRKPRNSIKLMRKKKGRTFYQIATGERNSRTGKTPKSLAILCERVIRKHKLFPAAQKEFTPPETFSVVGGKLLRNRSEISYVQKYTASPSKPKTPRKKLSLDPKRLVDLCRDVIQEYNLLPETEETLQPTGARKRGKGRQPKTTPDPLAALYTVKSSYPGTRPPQLSHVRIKEEVDLPPDIEEEEYTIHIKEEPGSGDEANFEVPVEAPEAMVIPPTAVQFQGSQRINKTQSSNVPTPGSSKRRDPPIINLMTVVLDDYQIFANNIAEQLRALPPSRALMLQSDIKTIIDNEKQLINDED